MSEPLKPCAHCGYGAELTEGEYDLVACCVNCGSRIQYAKEVGRAQVIAAWNRRAAIALPLPLPVAKDRKCGNCRYHVPFPAYAGDATITCHAGRPGSDSSCGNNYAVWPIVQPTDFCGEWAAKEEP
jgi:hypothetical protein